MGCHHAGQNAAPRQRCHAHRPPSARRCPPHLPCALTSPSLPPGPCQPAPGKGRAMPQTVRARPWSFAPGSISPLQYGPPARGPQPHGCAGASQGPPRHGGPGAPGRPSRAGTRCRPASRGTFPEAVGGERTPWGLAPWVRFDGGWCRGKGAGRTAVIIGMLVGRIIRGDLSSIPPTTTPPSCFSE